MKREPAGHREALVGSDSPLARSFVHAQLPRTPHSPPILPSPSRPFCREKRLFRFWNTPFCLKFDVDLLLLLSAQLSSLITHCYRQGVLRCLRGRHARKKRTKRHRKGVSLLGERCVPQELEYDILRLPVVPCTWQAAVAARLASCCLPPVLPARACVSNWRV